MISIHVYKLLHIAAVLFLFAALGAVALQAAGGGSKSDNRTFRLSAITHGVAVVVVLVSGFGMLARLGLSPGGAGAGWIWVKLGAWLLLGLALMVPYRRPELARLVFFAAPLLGILAAAMAVYKPF